MTFWRLFLAFAMATTIVACGGPPSGGSSVDTPDTTYSDVGFEDASMTDTDIVAEAGQADANNTKHTCEGKADCSDKHVDPCAPYKAKEWLTEGKYVCKVDNGTHIQCSLSFDEYKGGCWLKCQPVFWELGKKAQKCEEGEQCLFKVVHPEHDMIDKCTRR